MKLTWKKAEPAIKYSDIEQGIPPQPPADQHENCQHCAAMKTEFAKFEEVFGLILRNQKFIYDKVVEVQNQAGGVIQGEVLPEPVEEEEELSEEEVEAAIAAAKAKKKATVPARKPGRPKK